MSATAHPASIRAVHPTGASTWLARWWPLLAVTLLAAALRLSTLGLQSFWLDEAYTPVHVLHPSLWATLRGIARTENTPPLWYLLTWADSRVLGTGEIALRLPTALAGIATVPVAWAIGRELSGRRVAILCAVLVAVNPLFVWYSQEARAYGLSVLTGALAMLCFLRLLKEPTRRRMWAFALAGSLALLSHYFTVFILIPMVLWLLWDQRTRRTALPAVAIIALVGAALGPLVLAQGGQNTQWIGEWPLRQRLEAIPQYYLTGYSGGALGRRIELLVALPFLAALAFGAWRMIERARHPSAMTNGAPAGAVEAEERRSLVLVLSIAACGVLIPILMVGAGADYLAPRNLIAAMIPVTGAIALLTLWPGTGRVGIGLAAAIALAGLAISVDVNLSPSLQRSNWRELAKTLRSGPPDRVFTTVDLGSAPLQYYLPGLRLHKLRAGGSVLVRQIEETGYEPFRPSAAQPPAAGFRLISHTQVDGVAVYRFASPRPRRVSDAVLLSHVITLAGSAVLVPAGSHE